MWTRGAVCASHSPRDHTVKSAPCSPKDGQCECRLHITGRRCTEPAPGYFFAPLNFYLYEAEEATPLQGLAPLISATALPTCDVYFQQQGSDFVVYKGNIILKSNQKQSVHADEWNEGSVTFGQVPALHVVFREPVPGTLVAWTGPGFARVLPGAGLRFAVNNISFPMNFTIALRYEIQPAADWTVQVLANPRGGSEHCPRESPWPRPPSFPLPAASRIVLLPTPICLEPDVQYFIDVYFSQPLEGGSHAYSHILVDSLGLIPQINSLENFCSKQDLDEYQLHNCVEIASKAGPQVLPGVCERLIVSMSARLHDGAVACKCHPQGSGGPSCSRLGGQCQCKPHVAGRCCDRCSPGSYGLGHHGCHQCHCHPQGSKSPVCDQITGQCSCQGEVAGRRCDRCLQGYFGFPSCRPCLCNGFTELCDPETGSCFNCGGFTTGRHCERCIDGYYGNPPSGRSCRPCRCPDVPSSSQYFAHACYQHPWSSDVICNCLQGYAGKQCGECSAGFYGNPRILGASCQPCACNKNTDVTDPESCSRLTGECLKCLHNTQGPHCQFCKPGYFGSAVNQTCRSKSAWPPAGKVAAERGPVCIVPLDGELASVTLTLEHALVCPMSRARPVTVVQTDTGTWSPAEDASHVTVSPGPLTAATLTGQCLCKFGYDGKHCRGCKENYYGDPLGRCIPCDCNREGAQKPPCDQDTGMCRCREGVSGPRCDRCARGHGQEFPACLRCHGCFDRWDHTVSALSKAVQGLMKLAADTQDKRGPVLVCEANFKGLRENMSEIERILKHPVFSSGEFLTVKDYQDSVWEQIMQLSVQLKEVHEFPGLKERIGGMGNEADLLREDLQREINLRFRPRNASIMDYSENIKKHYQRSSSAEKKSSETTSIIKNSEKNRNDLLTIFDTLTSKQNLSLEKLKQITVPDIQILNEKVCGEPGDMPCVLSSCDGLSCRGSLPLSSDALQQAQEAEFVIHNLSDQVQGWKLQLKNVSKLAEVSKNNALQLSEKLRNMKNQSESEEEKMSLLIKKLKMFLSEENVPPEDIEKVANRVLDIHLPMTSPNLTHELDKIRKLMQLYEDYGTDEDRLCKAAEEAQKVLVKAKDAEKAANVLLNPDKTLNKWQRVQVTQGRVNSTITQLTAEITKIKKNVLQAENEAKDTKNELDLAKQRSVLEDGLSRLQTKLQRNREQATRVTAQATLAQRQAGGLEQAFAELKNQYAVLQHKTSATGPTKVTLEKVEQLKDKIQDLNLSRQEKADQLKQLEDQVVAIKSEIDEQENKSATCYT
ncbi:hypothetical protein GH733_013169 [Mirounga leonina]|nr:hypothetical protein GH733_013169 [Mirounga leonina]